MISNHLKFCMNNLHVTRMKFNDVIRENNCSGMAIPQMCFIFLFFGQVSLSQLGLARSSSVGFYPILLTRNF